MTPANLHQRSANLQNVRNDFVTKVQFVYTGNMHDYCACSVLFNDRLVSLYVSILSVFGEPGISLD